MMVFGFFVLVGVIIELRSELSRVVGMLIICVVSFMMVLMRNMILNVI